MEKKRTKMNECFRCQNMGRVLGNSHIKCDKPDPEMTGVPHGVKNGWFFYPLLFDPVWKEKTCNNFELKG